MSKRQLKVYIDTEFIEIPLSDKSLGNFAVTPISVGCFIPEQTINESKVWEISHHYTCLSSLEGIDNQWIKENVIPKLDYNFTRGLVLNRFNSETVSSIQPSSLFYEIQRRYLIDEFLIISDISGSDSCVFRQFFGGYFELEKLAPIDTIDLYSIAYARGILDEVKEYRALLVDEKYIHNALFDAWLVYKIDEEFQLTPTISHA
jgi:hypothetical protein